ncbi:MAG: hypothetical protein ABFC75_05815 [Rectinema sp.]
MFLRDRSDGVKLRQPHALNAVMPYLMRSKNGSAIYYEKDLDVENALHYVRAKNAANGPAAESGAPGGEGERYSLFALVLAAAQRTLAFKPEINNFIHGKALYRHKDIVFSFVVKKRMTEESPEANAKVFFDPDDCLDQVTAKVNAAILRARTTRDGPGEHSLSLAHAIPGGKALFTTVFRALDRINLAPARMIRDDPLYCSVYFANLGSLGLDAPFHHLYEWGNASVFIVLGKLNLKETRGPNGSPVRRHHLTLKATVDERIADGLYFASASSLFAKLIARPELLETPEPAGFRAD